MIQRTVVLLFLLSACGRTPMDDFTDGGGPPGLDGTLPPRDGGVDSDVPGCRSDAECDDGSFCNGSEACVRGSCAPGAPVACDDRVPCTADRCVEASRACESVPDGSRCPPGQVCDPRIGCMRRPCAGDFECQDGFVCNGNEVCAGGVCQAGVPPRCNDGIACTIDECSEAARGCRARPAHELCSDGRFCTGIERCVPEAGGCLPSMPIECNDFDRCTIDRCDDGVDRCVHTPSGDPTCMPRCPDGELGSMTGSSVALGTTGGAGNEHSGSCGGGGAPERTFRWTAPFEARWTFDTRGSGYDTLLYLLRGCAGPEVPGACDDDSDGTLQSRVTAFLSRGQTVIVVVDGFGSSSGAFQLNIRARAMPDGGIDAGVDAGPLDGGMCTDREIGVAACTDSRDGDCDGVSDCGDSDCSPFGPMWECCNGRDDDSDGQTDIFTCRCRTDADCRTVGSLEQVCWTETYSVCAPRCNFYGGTPFCQMFDPSLTCDATTGHCV